MNQQQQQQQQQQPARREIQLQGPRPAPLRVNKDSHKIRKPPVAPKPANTTNPYGNIQQQHYLQQHQHQQNQPMIIYSVSPKPIHVDPSNFMSIVQRLTGRNNNDTNDPTTATTLSSSSSSSGDMFSSHENYYFNNSNVPPSPVSPAARLAATERASPKERERRILEREVNDYDGNDVGLDTQELMMMPGILSPAPANLPTIPPGMFSPSDNSLFGFSDTMMSPFMGQNGTNSSFLPSPSNLFFNMVSQSPTPSPGGELFNIFDFS